MPTEEERRIAEVLADLLKPVITQAVSDEIAKQTPIIAKELLEALAPQGFPYQFPLEFGRGRGLASSEQRVGE